jgi:endogenous inhibitor of DNA gyrase (YacG/DUF329 family)
MIRGRCPICARTFEIARLDDLPCFPFCSDRCRLVDLGRWIDGTYKIPGPPTPTEPNAPASEEDEG